MTISFSNLILNTQEYYLLPEILKAIFPPIHAIGIGEQIDDLQPFDPEEFAAALTGFGD